MSDELEIKMGEALDAIGIEDDPAPIVDDEPKDKPDDNPPGYIDNVEDWVAAGKDPDDFKGKNAYKSEYNRIQTSRDEIADLKATMSSVVEGMSEWRLQEKEKARNEALAELDKATSEADVGKALAAKEKIDKLDSQPDPQAAARHPVMTDFLRSNPIIDKDSDQFDKDFFEDMAAMQSTILVQLGGPEAKVTDAQVSRIMKTAYSQAKAMHPDKFTSKRNARQNAPGSPSKRPAKSNDYSSRLKSAGGNSRNSNDNTPADDLYEILKAKNPEVADKFAKSILGD